MILADYWLSLKNYNRWAEYMANDVSRLYNKLGWDNPWTIYNDYFLLGMPSKPGFKCYHGPSMKTIWTLYGDGLIEFLPGREIFIEESIKSFTLYMDNMRHML